MGISEIVKKIRTAIYARDVRAAIADGIEQVNLTATQAVEKATAAQGEIDNAIAGKIGATIIDFGNVTGTGKSTILTPMNIMGDAASKVNGMIRGEKSGKYLYIINANVGQNIVMHFYPSGNVRVEMLNVPNFDAALMFINKIGGIVTLTENEYWKPMVYTTHPERGSCLLDAKIMLIRIGEA